MTATLDDWQRAQLAELRFNLTEMRDDVTREVHGGVAGLLRLDRREVECMSVLDVGCGPVSLMLEYPPRLGVALDPLYFAEYEVAYGDAHLIRVREAAETFEPTRTRLADEVWCYNCLQHVQDPARVLLNMMRWARDRIRIFEWVGEPRSETHLHTLSAAFLTQQLDAHGWRPLYTIVGTWRGRGVDGMTFYAAQWVPNLR